MLRVYPVRRILYSACVTVCVRLGRGIALFLSPYYIHYNQK